MDSRDEAGALECWLVRVRGRVQSIGYREACIHRARALGTTGWVRNRMDESVEAMLQGRSGQLAQSFRRSGVAVDEATAQARMQDWYRSSGAEWAHGLLRATGSR